MEGTPFEAIPALQTTWKFWRELHPETRVMSDEREGRPYKYQDFEPGTRRRRSGEHDTSTLGLGLVNGDEPCFYPFRELELTETPLVLELGGETLTIHFEPDALTAWAENQSGRMLMGVLAYEKRKSRANLRASADLSRAPVPSECSGFPLVTTAMCRASAP